jgi:hypothetical protein
LKVTFNIVKAAAAAFALSVGALAPSAHATPRPLPFSYPAETLPAGVLELEQYADLIPVRVAREGAASTDAVTSLRSVLATELEYGISDRLELGLYFAFRQNASATSPYFQFQGIKQRLRYRISDPATWPIELGVYGEVAEFHDEIELEQKILISKRWGRFGVASNLWIEQEYYFQLQQWRFIYNPTLGTWFEVSPAFSVGLEYWVRGRFDDPEPTATAVPELAADVARHYLGPTLMLQAGERFTSFGAYARLDHFGDDAVVGDQYGKLWFRWLIGIHLP